MYTAPRPAGAGTARLISACPDKITRHCVKVTGASVYCSTMEAARPRKKQKKRKPSSRVRTNNESGNSALSAKNDKKMKTGTCACTDTHDSGSASGVTTEQSTTVIERPDVAAVDEEKDVESESQLHVADEEVSHVSTPVKVTEAEPEKNGIDDKENEGAAEVSVTGDAECETVNEQTSESVEWTLLQSEESVGNEKESNEITRSRQIEEIESSTMRHVDDMVVTEEIRVDVSDVDVSPLAVEIQSVPEIEEIAQEAITISTQADFNAADQG